MQLNLGMRANVLRLLPAICLLAVDLQACFNVDQLYHCILALCRQFAGAGRPLRLAVGGVPDGRGGAEGLAPRLLRHEPLHRVDPPHGRQSGKLENAEVAFGRNMPRLGYLYPWIALT